MITKYRNRSILQFICALALTALLASLFFFAGKGGRRIGDGWIVLILLTHLATVVMWLVGSFTLARSKGYGNDMMGGVFIFLFIVGFCLPIAPYVFPAVVLFGLKDKTRERRSHHR